MYRTQGFADELQKLAAGSRAAPGLKGMLLRAMRSRPAKAGLMLGAGGLTGGALGLSSGRRKGYEAGTSNVEQVAIEALQMGRQQGAQAGYQFAMDQMLGKQASVNDGDGGYGRAAELNDQLSANTREPSMKEYYRQEAAKARQNAEKFKKGEIKHRKGPSIYDSPYAPMANNFDGSTERTGDRYIRDSKKQRDPKKRKRLAESGEALKELGNIEKRQFDLNTKTDRRDAYDVQTSRPKGYRETVLPSGDVIMMRSPEGKKAKGPIAVKKAPVRPPERKKQKPSTPRISVTPEVRDARPAPAGRPKIDLNQSMSELLSRQ